MSRPLFELDEPLVKMYRILTLLCVVIAAGCGPSRDAAKPAGSDPARTHSPYAGQEQRAIKTLSNQDVDDLLNGRGWGLAKAAELNGVPGPLHVLELRGQLGLAPDQVDQIEAVRSDMTAKALPLGKEYVALETRLNQRFASRNIDAEALEALLAEIASIHGQLRFVHLEAHLKTLDMLSNEQVDAYNRLRGYNVTDPCSSVPEGHDLEMWRRHNGCTG